MLKNKKIIYALAFVMMPAFVLLKALPTFADSVIFDGTGLGEDGAFHVYMAPPESMEEKYTLHEMINELAGDDWGITSMSNWECNEGFTACKLVYRGTDWTDESYPIVYEYDEAVKAKVDAILVDFEIPEDGFLVHDTELLKYWVFGGRSLGDISTEVKMALQNVNLEFTYDTRGGAMAPLEESNIGMAKVYYQGSLYKVIGGMPGPKVVAPHIFYVPTGTADEDKAEALFERFEEIYGDDVRSLVTIEPTEEMAGDLVDERYESAGRFDGHLDEKVYNFNIDFGEGASTYKIIIVADSDEMNAGFGVDSTDLITGVNIKTAAVNLPGDVATYAFGLGDDLGEATEEVIEKLGENFYAYEIGLFSIGFDTEIGDNGGEIFMVSVPVPESLKDAGLLSAYWMNYETGEPEEHYAKVVGNMATFETDHFSTYILAASSEDRPEEDEPVEDGEDGADESSESISPNVPYTGVNGKTATTDLAVTSLMMSSAVIAAGFCVVAGKELKRK